MAIRRSHPSSRVRNLQDDDRRPRMRFPLIAAMIGALFLMNVASAVLAMIE